MTPANDNEDMDFCMISAEMEAPYIGEGGGVTTYPAGTFTGRIIGGERVEQETLTALCGEYGRTE